MRRLITKVCTFDPKKVKDGKGFWSEGPLLDAEFSSTGKTTLKQNRLNTRLFNEVQKGRLGYVERLLEQGAEATCFTNKGITLLMVAAAGESEDHEKIAKVLIDHNAPLNAKDENGITALMFAALSGKPKMVLLLIGHGADVHAKDNIGRTPFMYAAMDCTKGNYESMVLLGAKGADPFMKDTREWDAFVYASLEGTEEMVEFLNSQKEKFIAQRAKDTALYLANATKRDGLKILSRLIKGGANVNARDENGQTPLMAAAKAGKLKLAEFFIKNKADLNAKDNRGKTALMYAVEAGRTRTAHLLRYYGAEK
jgi:ankyrin repeat protein